MSTKASGPSVPPEDKPLKKYDAFLSYSHEGSGAAAVALQRRLQTLGKSTFQRRVLHIFRDQTSLAATPELWPEIQNALSESRAFILMASPDAAKSPWVR